MVALPMLSAIGLALDLVGAIALVIGLFRRSRPLYVGWSYSPDEAARGCGYGVSGGTLLTLGFVFQSLTYFGVTVNYSDRAALLAAAGTLIVATVGAVVLYGVTFLIVLPREIRYTRENHNLVLHARRERAGFGFWNQDFTAEPGRDVMEELDRLNPPRPPGT